MPSNEIWVRYKEQTITFDQNGFLDNAQITISKSLQDYEFDTATIEQVAKHEMGHALGLGHANFNESLMSSLVYHSFNKISDCEREAVMEANKWKLIDNDSSPQINKIKKYFC